MAIRLFIQKEGDEPRELDFEGPVVAIGRGDENHLVVDDVRSSRKHCTLSETPQGAVLEDLGSSNGTRYKGELVKKSLLSAGDKFQIGSTSFFFDRLPEEADDGMPVPPDKNSGGSPADILDEIEQAEAAAVVSGQEDGGAGILEEPETAGEIETSLPDIPPADGGGPAVADDGASQQEDGAPPTGGAILSLKQLVGELEDPAVNVEDLPFSIGRSSGCDLTLTDQRASGRHAEVVSKDGVLAIVDLDSKNGVLVDDRKVKKAAVLGDGSRISIGSHLFDVRINDPGLREKSTTKARMQEARRAELMPRGESAEAMKLSVDIDSVNQGGSLQQIFSIVLVVAIVVFSAVFCVRIARDILATDEIDRKVAANRVSNWSFEETVPDGGDEKAVVGWTARQGVRIRRVETGISGGFHALELKDQGAGGSGIYSAFNTKTVILNSGQQYLFEGYVTNYGAFLAGLMVEWIGSNDKLLGRSFSIPRSGGANTRGRKLEAIQIVSAPGEDAVGAKISCFIMGQGKAIFDQVSFAPVKPAAGVDAAPGEEGEAPSTKASDAEKTWGWTDPLPGEVRMQKQAPGVFSLRRGNKQILSSFWAGIDDSRDPNIIGPQLTDSTPPREADDGTLIVATQVPDLAEKKWIWVQNVLSADSSSVSLNWQLELQGKKADQERALVVYFDFLDPKRKMVAHGPRSGAEFSLGEASGGPFDELVLGNDDQRTSMEFTRTVNISARAHPVLEDRWLLVIVPADGASDLGVTFSHGSRREAQAARMKLAEAERLFGAGKASEAISLLGKLPKLYPLQEAEIARSTKRIAQWNADAGKVVADLDVGLAVYRGNPSEVIYRSLRSRGKLLSGRYANTTVGASVDNFLARLDSLRTTAARGKANREQEELFTRAQKFGDDKQFGVADLHLQMLLDRTQEGSQVHQDALNLRERLKTRWETVNKIKLGQ